MTKWRDRFGGEHAGSFDGLLHWAGDELPDYGWMHSGRHGSWSLLTTAGSALGFDPTREGGKFAPPPERPEIGASPYFFVAADRLFAWDVKPRWVLREIPNPRPDAPDGRAITGSTATD